MRKIAALSIASVFASGCGTTASQLGYWDGEPDPRLPYIWGGTTLPYIYGGTTFDVAVVVDAAKADGPGGIAALLVFDLPFSLVADTVLLPLTIYQQIDRAFWTEEQFIQSLSHPDSAVRAHAANSWAAWMGPPLRASWLFEELSPTPLVRCDLRRLWPSANWVLSPCLRSLI